MIWPTEFCSVRPSTIDVIPSAVNSPPTSAPQMYENMIADTDRDEREPRDVEEYRRNPLAPAAFWRALEQGGVQSG